MFEVVKVPISLSLPPFPLVCYMHVLVLPLHLFPCCTRGFARTLACVAHTL